MTDSDAQKENSISVVSADGGITAVVFVVLFAAGFTGCRNAWEHGAK